MKSSHPTVYYKNISVSSTSVHKHLGMLLSANSPETVFNCNLQIVHSASFRLWRYCLWSSLTYIYKNLESIQYNAAITITGAIRGASSEKLFHKLGLWADYMEIFHPGMKFQVGSPSLNFYNYIGSFIPGWNQVLMKTIFWINGWN